MSFRYKRRIYTHTNSSVVDLAMSGSTGLSDAQVGDAYSTSVDATGGVRPYVAFTVIGGSLPTSLLLSTSGTLSGVPSTTSISTFTVQVTDSVGSTARASYRLQVISSGASAPPTLSIQNSTGAPQGVVNSAYSLQINSTGGVPPYGTFTVVSGTLPTGLSMSAAGLISGTPSTVITSTFTVQAVDSVGSTVSQSFRLNVISSAAAASTSPHAYFDYLTSLPEHYRSWSLRSSTQLDAIAKISPSTDFVYIWPNDGYADAQDAAKLVHAPAATNVSSDSVNSPLRPSLGYTSTLALLLTWDWYSGVEFKTNIGKVGNWKHFQVADYTSSNATGSGLAMQVNSAWTPTAVSSQVAVINMRNNTSPVPPGVTNPGTLQPTGESCPTVSTYPLMHSVWTRYWLEVRPRKEPADFTSWIANSTATQAAMSAMSTAFRMVTLWVADENRDAQRIYYQLPWSIRGSFLANFYFECNTSTVPAQGAQTGTVVGYARNLVALSGYALSESDTAIFKRPTR